MPRKPKQKVEIGGVLLTYDELEALRLQAQAVDRLIIAKRLGLSKPTIDKMLSGAEGEPRAIYRRIGVVNASEASAWYVHHVGDPAKPVKEALKEQEQERTEPPESQNPEYEELQEEFRRVQQEQHMLNEQRRAKFVRTLQERYRAGIVDTILTTILSVLCFGALVFGLLPTVFLNSENGFSLGWLFLTFFLPAIIAVGVLVKQMRSTVPFNNPQRITINLFAMALFLWTVWIFPWGDELYDYANDARSLVLVISNLLLVVGVGYFVRLVALFKKRTTVLLGSGFLCMMLCMVVLLLPRQFTIRSADAVLELVIAVTGPVSCSVAALWLYLLSKSSNFPALSETMQEALEYWMLQGLCWFATAQFLGAFSGAIPTYTSQGIFNQRLSNLFSQLSVCLLIISFWYLGFGALRFPIEE